MIAGRGEAPPAAVASVPRIRTRFLVALVVTNIVLIVWATVQLSAALSTAPVPRNRVEPPSVASAQHEIRGDRPVAHVVRDRVGRTGQRSIVIGETRVLPGRVRAAQEYRRLSIDDALHGESEGRTSVQAGVGQVGSRWKQVSVVNVQRHPVRRRAA